jgi:antirestriction protein ArdC
MPFSKKRLGWSKPVSVYFESDVTNGSNILGKTAYYDPNNMSVTLFTDFRHPKDIMRSLSHELVHHTQNCRGEFDKSTEMGEGYAQADEHLRNMEKEAYLQGNMCFRDWEDTYKHDLATNYTDVSAMITEKKERLFGLLTKQIIKEKI